MKILRYRTGDGPPAYGILEDDGTVLQMIGSPFENFQAGAKVAAVDEVRVLPPVEPTKIIGVGLNYVSHIEESGMATPEFPMLFVKPNTAIIGQGDAIVYPRKGQKVEYEAELAAVIGRPARHVAKEHALDYVLGYTCGNDVSERVIQLAEMKMGALLVGKGFDTFNPLGPVVETDVDPGNVDVRARLNGVERQNANTSDLLFGVAELVSYISDAMSLLPGDVIMTGTPAGVGPMAPGNVVEIDIGGIGVLRNHVIAEEGAGG